MALKGHRASDPERCRKCVTSWKTVCLLSSLQSSPVRLMPLVLDPCLCTCVCASVWEEEHTCLHACECIMSITVWLVDQSPSITPQSVSRLCCQPTAGKFFSPWGKLSYWSQIIAIKSRIIFFLIISFFFFFVILLTLYYLYFIHQSRQNYSCCGENILFSRFLFKSRSKKIHCWVLGSARAKCMHACILWLLKNVLADCSMHARSTRLTQTYIVVQMEARVWAYIHRWLLANWDTEHGKYDADLHTLTILVEFWFLIVWGAKLLTIVFTI